MSRIHVIGISAGGALTDEAARALAASPVIYASERLYAILMEQAGEAMYKDRCRVINSVSRSLAHIRRDRRDVAVMASGDPMFFGIGAKIVDEFPRREVRLYPALSSMQLAFSRAALSWHDAYAVSFHGARKRQWAVADLPLLCELHDKLAILTGEPNTPATIAAHLPKDATVWVAERLGHSDERVRKLTPAKVKKTPFKDPNIMIVEPAGNTIAPAFGLVEKQFRRTGELITKDEVRAVALHKLRLPRGGVLWDIGAGSGSVGIEARRLSPGLEVYAMEKDTGRAANIEHNALALNCGRINIIRGEAPEALKGLPAPDRVFIGGSGSALQRVIGQAMKRLKAGGTIVVTAVTLESVESAMAAFNKAGHETEITQVSVARGNKLGKGNYMKALNPVFILKVDK